MVKLEKMKVKEALEFIRKHKRYGDKIAICSLAGVSRQTFNNMLKHKEGPDKEKWFDSEYLVLCEAVAYLKPKVAQREKKIKELEKKLSTI